MWWWLCGVCWLRRRKCFEERSNDVVAQPCAGLATVLGALHFECNSIITRISQQLDYNTAFLERIQREVSFGREKKDS